MRTSRLVFAAFFIASCSDTKPEAPGECFPGDEDVPSSNVPSYPLYRLKNRNFRCETNPIQGNWLLDVNSFIVPSGISSTETVKARFNEARAAWNASGSRLEVRYADGEVSPGAIDSTDDEHHMFLSPAIAGPEADGTYALTWLHGDPADPHEATNCDTEFFTHADSPEGVVSIDWTDSHNASGDDPGTEDDLWSLGLILEHELGHCVGFKENTISGSVMNWYHLERGMDVFPLHTSDQAALVHIYGSP